MAGFESNLTDIWYGNEIEVSIGYYDGSSWSYETIEYRQGFTPDNPDETEGVNDGLEYKGDKRVYVENTVDLSQYFRGFSAGLTKYENLAGLVVRMKIIPDGGTIPAEVDDTMWLTNVNFSNYNLDDVPNTGSFNVNLSGRWDDRVYTEPTGSEDWVVDNSGNLS